MLMPFKYFGLFYDRLTLKLFYIPQHLALFVFKIAFEKQFFFYKTYLLDLRHTYIVVCLILCIFAKIMDYIQYCLLEDGKNKNKQILHSSLFGVMEPSFKTLSLVS